MLFILGLLESA